MSKMVIRDYKRGRQRVVLTNHAGNRILTFVPDVIFDRRPDGTDQHHCNGKDDHTQIQPCAPRDATTNRRRRGHFRKRCFGVCAGLSR